MHSTGPPKGQVCSGQVGIGSGGGIGYDARVAKLSIIMPVYNERATVQRAVERVLAVPVDKELIAVDDCSADGSFELLRGLAGKHSEVRLFRHEENRGKGAALRTGFCQVCGEVVVIQDADLEYHPEDFPRLLAPIERDEADVVYGSRFLGHTRREFISTHAAANRLLTLLSNWMTGLRLSDMETCYKMFRADLLDRFALRSSRFEIEPELTAAFARLDVRILEVPISYAGRDKHAGKKIGVRDGLEAIGAIVRYNLFPSLRPPD